jgi:FkbM family methyltransferase
MFSINSNPLMTNHLVSTIGAFRDDPVVIIDVGARGGFNTEWGVFADQIRLYGFEPDEEECRLLVSRAPAHVTYIPWALGGKSGAATLYHSKLNASTSLYKTKMDYFTRFLNWENGLTIGESTIIVRTLDEVLSAYNITSVDFIKLDAEGAELDILLGAANCFGESSPLGILSEIRFHEEINGSPPFASLDSFVRSKGLRLYDLDFNRESKRALPYPSVYDYRLPTGERFFAYTTHGQIQDGDALYFRDLLLASEPRAAELSVVKVLKLASLFELYSLNDCAAELILANQARLAPEIDCNRLLDLLASGINGRDVSFEDYARKYFETPIVAPDLKRQAENLKREVENLSAEVAAFQRSTSWRVTRPLRFFANWIAKAKEIDS